MKTIVSFLIGVFAVLAMAIPAEAQYSQYGSRGGYRRPLPGGWGGGRYNHGYYELELMALRDFLKVPGVLGSCRLVNHPTKPGKHAATDCNWLTRAALDEQGRPTKDLQDHLEAHPRGTYALGAQHANNGVMEFRSYDPTHNPFNRNHKDCLDIVIPPEPVARSISDVVQSSAPSQEQGTVQPVAGPAANVGEGQFELSNQTRVYVDAYDGETYIGRMEPGAKMMVDPPKDRYRGFALVPTADGRLGKDELGREVSPSGWSFIEPKVAQGR